MLSGFSNIIKKDEDEHTPLFSPYKENLKINLKEYLLNEINPNPYENQETDEEKLSKILKQNIIKNKNNLIKFLKNDELREKHNQLVEELFNPLVNATDVKIKENILKEIPLILDTTPIIEENYNLFFMKNGCLFEFRPCEKRLIRKSYMNVTNLNVMEYIHEEIIKEQTSFKYLDDLTIFSNDEPVQEVETNLKNDGVIIVLLVTILFILNFIYNNPENTYVSYY